MITVITMLLGIGIIGIIIGGIMDIKSFKDDKDFSWKPLIFCAAGFFLFALGIFLRYSYAMRLL